MSVIVEIVKFKLQDGVTSEAFSSINDKIALFLSKQEGLVSRHICFDDKAEEYTDIVHWRDKISAENAQDAYFESEVCAELGAMIIQSSVEFGHNKLLSSLPAR